MKAWAVLLVGASLCLGGMAGGQEEQKAPDVAADGEKKEAGKGEEKKPSEKKAEPAKAEEKGEKDKAEKTDKKGAGEKEAKDEAEEIVVTATKTSRVLREVGKSMTVVTSEEIEARHPTNMAEMLRGLPGLRLTTQGGTGGMQSLQIRGARSEHTVLLIDGIPITDPTSPHSDINSFFGDISPEDIERIEILRGAQSTLYGSDAMGGVVNIILKEGKKKPSIGATWEGGSQNTSKETVNAGGSFDLPVLDRVDVKVTGTRIDSTGVPSLSDSYENTSATLNSRLFLTPELSMGTIYRSLYVRQHYDDFDSYNQWPPGPVMDHNQARRLDQDFVAFDVRHDVADWLDYKVVYSESRSGRLLRDDLNPAEDLSYYYWLQGSFSGRTSDFNPQVNFHPFEDLITVSLGCEFEKQSMRSTQTEWSTVPPWWWPPDWRFSETGADLSNKAFYMETQIELWKRLSVSGGIRKDHHSTWYGHDTGEISAAFIMPYTDTKLKGNWGLGFKSPSLYQLYDPIVGTPSLTPENSESWDIGFEQPLFKKRASVELIYFQNDFYNLIDWVNTNDPGRIYGGEYQNVGAAETDGIELTVKAKPMENLQARCYYTYTHSAIRTGVDKGRPLENTPADIFGVEIKYKPVKQLTIDLNLNYSGRNVWYQPSEVPNTTSSPGPHMGGLDNPAFWKADLSVTYQVSEWLKIWGRCENMFDQVYTQHGMPGARIGAYGGVGVRF